MVELVNGMDFHNFNLDCKPKEWFKRNKEKETVSEWLTRVSYHPEIDFLQNLKFRKKNEYWLKDSARISIFVLSFLRENSLKKETLEELVGFDLNLKGSHNFTLSELKSLEIYTNLDLCSLKNI